MAVWVDGVELSQKGATFVYPFRTPEPPRTFAPDASQRCALRGFLFLLSIRETWPKVLAINAENGVDLQCRDSGIGSAFVLRPDRASSRGFFLILPHENIFSHRHIE